MSALPDLVTTPLATDLLAKVIPNDPVAITLVPFLVTAASAQVRKYCKRDFTQTDYSQFAESQVIHGIGFSEIQTQQYPVNWITRLSVMPTTILSVQNTSTSNQRATVQPSVTGDVTTGLSTTGLTLTTVASAVTTTNTLPFATYPTATAMAGAITALGNGWLGVAASGFGQWAMTEVLPTFGVQGCLAAGSGAELQAYTLDADNYDFDPRTGIIRLRNQTFDPVFALMNLTGASAMTTFPIRWRGVRIEYNAGYATIPNDVQQAVLLTLRLWVAQLTTDPRFVSESDVDWSVTLNPLLNQGLPIEAKQILQPYRSMRQQ